jgi:hypothetical protein
MVTVMADGAAIRNISRTHALYVEGDGYRIRLPRMEENGIPAEGWFLCAGTAYVGSRSMLDDEQPLAVTIIGGSGAVARRVVPASWPGIDGHLNGSDPSEATGPAGRADPDVGPPAATTALSTATGSSGGSRAANGEGTLLPFYIDPMTKLFLVALLWCRPWLLDQSGTRPLPRTPEIARGALEVTGAYHELERFDSSQDYRDALAARVAEHIKVLRRKVTDRGLARADVRLSDEVAVRILIEHGIITSADLGRLDDPAWRSRQEDLWWTLS